MKVNNKNNFRYIVVSMLLLVGLISGMANIQPVSAQENSGSGSSTDVTFAVDGTAQGELSALSAPSALNTDFSADSLGASPSGWLVSTKATSQWGVTGYDPVFTPTTGAANSASGGNKLWVAAGGASPLDPSVSGYPLSNKTTIIYNIDLSKFKTSAELTFWYYNDSEDCTSPGVGGDFFRWGASRGPRGPFRGTQVSGFSGGWHQVTLDLAPYRGKRSVWIAFQFISDGDANVGDGAYVDDVTLSAVGSKKIKATPKLSGYVLESGFNTDTGISVRKNNYWVGDNVNTAAYRSLLSFNTFGAVPSGSVITSADLMVKFLSFRGDSFTVSHSLLPFGDLAVYGINGTFGTSALLSTDDFNAPLGTYLNPFPDLPVLGVYTLHLSAGQAASIINNAGTTQFRLQFVNKTDSDAIADIMKFKQPTLLVNYETP